MKKFFKWILSQLKDKTTIIIFLILTLIAISPILLGYTLGFIFKNNYLIGIATAYIVFWAAPLTPIWSIVIGLTLSIRKIIKEIAKRRNKNGRK